MIFQAALLCGTGTLLALLLKRDTPELAMATALLTSALLLCSLADGLREIFRLFRELGERTGLAEPLFIPLYKAMGIAAVVRVGGNLCKDARETALEAGLELAGTVCAFLAALPLLRMAADMLMRLMG